MKKAILLTNGLYDTEDAKTAHGLVRESNRYKIAGVIDHVFAGNDAGVLLDSQHRNIPVYATVTEAMAVNPEVCIVGVATSGGIFPGTLLNEVKEAIGLKLDIVNGLHDHLNDRPEIKALAAKNNVQLIDIRRPKRLHELHFWTGKIFEMNTPVVAVIGTDCALGKRTTTRFVMNACNNAGMNTQMIYTGQTGWLQGGKYGFIFDSTLNDFVSGELEHAILTCNEETNPDVIFIEGQSALRNPTGPCGSELLISGNAKSVILVTAPKRKYYEHEPVWGEIPSLASEIELIKQFSSTVIAIAINTEHCNHEEAFMFQKQYETQFGIPVMLPLQEGCEKIVPVIKSLRKS
ncbi:DUF1611 domain-containing protein [Parafilimonas terrae]|uniref:Uncharacterized conserved protein, NAD-dependent epimerase/dehydratase family n=1 Tax=Parafilimonas terrae TaxID=1465490 RepID=A0A1I5Z451_9BACT|nr:DUF1611 domain-containing protein [Parafilimonas terrae]SFQ51238.1 Uncharacterized conserved protein, NAD-dependent epimerase/dehydratase family [Parafilimonas terrae]